LSTAAATMACTSLSFDTSHLTPIASLVGYLARRASAAREMVASFISARTTLAPSDANWMHVSRPIPLGVSCGRWREGKRRIDSSSHCEQLLTRRRR